MTVVTLAEGEISELHVGLKGTMNALFLKDLAAKTHRGLRGRVEAGKSGGGLCYGYDVVKSFDGSGDPVRGGRTVNETEAEIVRRVFREFADGASPRAIARRLNGGRRPRPFGQALDGYHHPGPREARHGPHQQRALYRAAGVEPAALRQEPGDRQAGVADQPAGGVDRRGGPRSPHRRRRAVEGGEGRQGEITEQYATVIEATQSARSNRLNGAHRPRTCSRACSNAASAAAPIPCAARTATAAPTTS